MSWSLVMVVIKKTWCTVAASYHESDILCHGLLSYNRGIIVQRSLRVDSKQRFLDQSKISLS